MALPPDFSGFQAGTGEVDPPRTCVDQAAPHPVSSSDVILSLSPLSVAQSTSKAVVNGHGLLVCQGMGDESWCRHVSGPYGHAFKTRYSHLS